MTAYIVTGLLMAAIGAFAFFLLHREGLVQRIDLIAISVILLLGTLTMRFLAIDYETLDYQWFLGPWVQHFRDHGGFAALAHSVGNYNVTYLYFLAFFSYLPLPDLHLIKLLSIFFDVVLAFYVMRIVGLYVKSDSRRRAAFFIVLYLPTVFLNGAYWGQCDSIYVTFAVMGFYYALAGRPVLSMIGAALSLAFKLQAVFLLPLYPLLLFARRIKLRHLPVFPVTYLLVILPVVLIGRPFWDTLLLYINQAHTAGTGLNYNSPSIFTLVRAEHYDPFWAALGVAWTVAFVLLVYLFTLSRGRNLSNENLLTLGIIFAVGVPLLLPHMNDRYFFLADIFAVCLGLSRLRYLPAIALTQFASLLGYHAYLQQRFFMPMRYGTFALLILMAVLLIDLVWTTRQRR